VTLSHIFEAKKPARGYRLKKRDGSDDPTDVGLIMRTDDNAIGNQMDGT
jgi:hypothetical protein